jgi:omega-6 fatty acid desaturase (delta-12 desaturase)
MRTSAELVKATKPFAREQRLRSWWHLLSTLAVLAGLLTVTCLPISWLIRLPFSILAGLVMVRMFIIYHDYQHGTILRGSWVADTIMNIYGLLTLSPPGVWTHTHNTHHKHNCKIPGANLGSFPIMTTEEFAKASRARRWAYWVARNPLTILLGYFTVFFFTMTLSSFMRSPKDHWDSGISLIFHLGVAAILAVTVPLSVFLLTMAVPWMVGAAVGAYLFYAQHNFPDVQLQSEDNWDYSFAALKSSSFMTMNPVMQWFTGNIGYHHVHHLNAHIPFYRLPEVMAALPELQSPGKTSLNPVDIYRCLRLKLWDREKKRMVGYRGV